MPSFNDILTRIEEAIEAFNKGIPGAQKAMLDGIDEELRRLDLRDGKIKATVANLKVVASIKNKLLKIVLNDDYIENVKEFVQAFKDVGALQNEYWKSVEKTFKPSSILKEIRNQAIGDTVNKLTEAGIGSNIGERLSDILRTNITTGGSYKDLTAQLRESLTNTDKSDGLLSKYAKQITTDSVNQYNAQYTQVVSSDLGYEWYAYQGTEITTSRPFCQSMVEERRYFHISEIPALLRADNMYYTDNKTKKRIKVTLNPKTNLPDGFIEGTNPENFFVRRAGYQCGHQIRPVSDRLVISQDKAAYDRVLGTQEYKAWKSSK